MPSIEEGLVTKPVETKAIVARVRIEKRVPKDANALTQIEALREVIADITRDVEESAGFRGDVEVEEVFFTR